MTTAFESMSEAAAPELGRRALRSGAHILIVGDAMLDRYHEGATDRISPEAPVPVLRVSQTYDRPGGSANVALNIAMLGMRVTLLANVGDDPESHALQSMLEQAGVTCRFRRAPASRTIVKIRAISMHQQVMRIDFENGFDATDRDGLLADYRALLGDAQLVVFSDYAKGTLSGVAELIDAARQAGVPTVVDPKGADFERYRGATVLTPNEAEFRAASDGSTEFESAAAALRARLEIDNLLVTRGDKGMVLFRESAAPMTLPAEARDVFDVTGAGDTVVATLASALTSGWPMEDAVALANCAAGIVVGRRGTASVTASELAQVELGVDNAAAVLRDVKVSRMRGERIVMTNGCFDILHAGHVHYLAQARARGDRLLVAVNSDRSVSRLKGAGRPYNSLAQRLEVLGALKWVDWLMVFGDDEAPGEEDLPLRLIRAVRPDVLVKGADYTVETIVGAVDNHPTRRVTSPSGERPSGSFC
ncbi:bifunctional D-glycero-beta-D-manno-heptose-7-phosphate kinase/D-glycero-beta-D-manno-heptose 1-phosphate adenylyltransferase HldE [Sphingomonas sp. IW22]|uniref:bifunctional D-glycero-beta-D-manno-heptose-7-phosphate kinase/D-glycero-beta-D-manno-heptose 1-phosphate adenylyltransferase HldE n=1 Tax=Sphingomonas sp. IW22 TaxID=3242489 RepID=UPI0035209C8B